MEEMEKRSDRHIRDLVAHTAFKGLDANEIGCARISVMAGSNCSLQRAEYRCARPIISKLSYPTCNARPVHTDVPREDDRAIARDAVLIGRFY
jgi:hypothetical protein